MQKNILRIGLFMGFVFMLGGIDPETFAPGFTVAMLTTLYAFIAAAGFLIADMRHSGDCARVPVTSTTLSESMEQAKEIIDRVVEAERH